MDPIIHCTARLKISTTGGSRTWRSSESPSRKSCRCMVWQNEAPSVSLAPPPPAVLTLFTKLLGQRALILEINDAFLYNAGPVGKEDTSVVVRRAGSRDVGSWPGHLWLCGFGQVTPPTLCLSLVIGKLAFIIMHSL